MSQRSHQFDETGSANFRRSPDAPRFFSKGLPILGLIIGAFYFVTLFAAGALGPPKSQELPASYRLVKTSESNPCEGSILGTPPLPNGEAFIGYGHEPMRILIEVPALPAIGRAILSLDASVDRASLWACNPSHGPDRQVAGDLVPFSARSVSSEDMAFVISATKFPAYFVLEMVQNAAISQRWFLEDEETFQSNANRRLMIRLAAYGALGIMIAYNLILSVMAKNAAFAFNACIAFSMLLLDVYLSGFGSVYLWPEAPYISNIALAVGLAGPSIFGPFYMAHFLNDEEQVLHLRLIDVIWPALAVALLFVNLLGFEVFSLIALTAVWIAMTLYYAVRVTILVRACNERAAILLLPILGAVVPAMIAGSYNSWAQPDFGILQDHLTEFALVLESLTFTLALAYLLRIARWREHDALRQLNLQSVHAKQTLLRTIDADRTRMASELHDTAGQGLLLAVSKLNQVRDQTNDIQAISRMVHQTLSDLRSLSHDLHPATLEHLGLSDALTALIENARQLTSARILFSCDLTGLRFQPTVALHIYRIIQELLANAVNYAEASKITVEIAHIESKLQIAISDNGIGKESRVPQTGIGSTIIAERVEALGGHMDTDFTDGTRVTVFAPLASNLEGGASL